MQEPVKNLKKKIKKKERGIRIKYEKPSDHNAFHEHLKGSQPSPPTVILKMVLSNNL